MSGRTNLKTEYQEGFGAAEIPYTEYPRPQMKRDSYVCLNGLWSFSLIDKNGKEKYGGSILVPFAPESEMSGVCIDIGKDDTLIYERTFSLGEDFFEDSALLHIGACDQYATVYINGEYVGKNIGGYLPFSFDVGKYLSVGENTIRVEARDPLSLELPYGKQSKRSHGMWYTKISGIWQTVWLEALPKNPIIGLKIDTDTSGVDITVEGGEYEKLVIMDGKEYAFCGQHTRIEIDVPKLWSPDEPNLYEFELVSGEDRVGSYFGLRTLKIEKRGESAVILVNGKPTFFHGLLDQGYFSDGIFLPATPSGFADDILKMKECGFNTLRKHIKLEPDLFYYYCDKYGMFVFQDMINSGKYSFLYDTALPTVFMKKAPEHRASKTRRAEFQKTSVGIIEKLYNHPSVVYYTIFNEGWGQFDTKGNYEYLKSIDPTRIYDSASGWFKTEHTDVESDHVYFKPVKVRKNNAKPWILSEFGGYSYAVEGHIFSEDKSYGYKTFENADALQKGFESLYRGQIIPAIESGLCSSILTQVSDVEEEINGLLTYDRRVLKVNSERFKELSDELYDAFSKKHGIN